MVHFILKQNGFVYFHSKKVSVFPMYGGEDACDMVLLIFFFLNYFSYVFGNTFV